MWLSLILHFAWNAFQVNVRYLNITRIGYMPQFNDFQVTWNVKVDLLVLRYMARKIAYFLPDAAAGTPLPRVHFAQEQRNRINRIVINRRGAHLRNERLLLI